MATMNLYEVFVMHWYPLYIFQGHCTRSYHLALDMPLQFKIFSELYCQLAKGMFSYEQVEYFELNCIY